MNQKTNFELPVSVGTHKQTNKYNTNTKKTIPH
jgi:hypothetical protein